MDDLRGKVAFITGGASGIGLAMAEAFGREGMSVMLADIEAAALTRAVEELRAKQVRVEGVVADVTSRAAMRQAALETIAKFGKVHVVCNNAGIGAGGAFGQVPEKDWDWAVDVNLMGVVYGMEVFQPLIASHGEGGHFVNTASMAGMVSAPGMEPYTATKYAVVGMSEGWQVQLAPFNIGVSVLCPGFVQTRIHQSSRNKPDAYGAATAPVGPSMDDIVSAAVEAGIPPGVVAGRVVEAIKDNDLYIFTHPEFKEVTNARFQRILAAFDKSKDSPALNSIPKRDVPTPSLGLEG